MKDINSDSTFGFHLLQIEPAGSITEESHRHITLKDIIKYKNAQICYNNADNIWRLAYMPISLGILFNNFVDREGGYEKMLKNVFISMIDKESNNFNNMLINNIKNAIKDNFVISYDAQVFDTSDAVYKFISLYDKKNLKKYANCSCNNVKFRKYKSFIKYNKNTFIQILTGDYAFKHSFSDQNKALMNAQTVSTQNFVVINFIGKDAYKLMKRLQKFIEKDEHMNSYQYMVTYDNKRNDIIRTFLTLRDFDSLFFSENTIAIIKDHLNNFKNNMKLYAEKNLIYKTGILLYGEPGTGKSSLALAIASYLNCSIININMSQFDKIDLNRLATTINSDRLTYVVLLEDIDTIIKNRTADDVELSEQKIINKLLQFLDSGASPTNVVFIATTNHIDKLDNAILRDGRFDLKLEIKGITNDIDAEIMCNSFNLTKDQIRNVLKDVKYPVNQSYLQGLILKEIKNN